MRSFRFAAPFAIAALILTGAAAKPDRTLEAALRAHIAVLASDGFQGREPGTEGEVKTLRYLAGEWFRTGLVSGTNDPGNPWFAPVEFIERTPSRSRALFQRNRRAVALPATGILVLTSGPRQLVEGAPLVFLGKADGSLPPRSELAGRIAVILDGRSEGEAEPSRQDRLLSAGAGAVLTVLDGDRTIDAVAARRNRAGYALASEAVGGDLEAFVTAEYAAALFGAEWPGLVRAASAPQFAPQPLPLSGTLEATTRETRIASHNLIGRLPGRFPDRGAVLILAHWDHFGVCAEPPAEDLICNGAIDNASGLAVITEVARRLTRGKRLDRDVYFLATTGEELGFLGARAFVDNPPVPIDGIVAAFNIDSPALGPPGRPLAVIGHGRTPLDGGIARVAKSLKREVRQNAVADGFLMRQDAWALLQSDIPAVMVSGSYSDPAVVTQFMDAAYHRPSDELRAETDLGGAAQEVGVQLALVRWFATVANYPGRARKPAN